MRFVLVLLVCSLICQANPSRCPEPKKPHLTSCTIFYTCVNVPGGGYVWVPSKCNEGLVFQPYLRMCVIPGDIWTCDTLSTERAPTTKYGTPELIEPTDTSYLGYTQDPSGFSETIDSSYVIDDFSDPTTEATPYPLIEFEEDETKYGDKSVGNASYHREENYLYIYTNSQGQSPLSLMQEYKNIVDSHYKWLNELMSRLHIYKELSATVSSSLTVPIRDATVNPTQIIIFASHNQRQNVSLNYLAQGHTEGNELHNGEPIEVAGTNGPQVDSVIATTDSTVPTESALELLIDSLDSDNSIIRISDNLGTKQYLTIERYRAVAHRLTARTISVVACTRNVRLPNRTDCNRYYMCEPKTATVLEYSCPLHTAFNVYSRICDVESVKTCGGSNRFPTNEIFIERVENEQTTTKTYVEASEERLCREIGKIKDPASESHYYICYDVPDSEEIQSIRMTCPNTLIFCQSKKVCTTRRLCDALP